MDSDPEDSDYQLYIVLDCQTLLQVMTGIRQEKED